MSDNMLRIGLPKGSLQNSTIELFRKAGFPITVDERAYSPDLGDDELWAVLLRAQECARLRPDGSGLDPRARRPPG